MSTIEANREPIQSSETQPAPPANASHVRWLSFLLFMAAVLLGIVIYSPFISAPKRNADLASRRNARQSQRST